MPIDPTTPAGMGLALLPEVVLSVAAMAVLLAVAGAMLPRRQPARGLAGPREPAARRRGPRLLCRQHPRGTWGLGARRPSTASGTSAPPCSCWCRLGRCSPLLGYLERERLVAPEYYVLLLLAVVGLLFMVNAQDLIVLFSPADDVGGRVCPRRV